MHHQSHCCGQCSVCLSKISSKQGQEHGCADHRHCKLVLETWNVMSLLEKKQELVQKVESILGLPLCASSGTNLLERGRILFLSRVTKSERCGAGMDIITSPRQSTAVLEFSPFNESCDCLLLEGRPSCGLWVGLWRGCSLVLLGDFNAAVANNGETCR